MPNEFDLDTIDPTRKYIDQPDMRWYRTCKHVANQSTSFDGKCKSRSST